MNADWLFEDFLRNLSEDSNSGSLWTKGCTVRDRGCPDPAVGYRKPAMGFYSGRNLQDIRSHDTH
jgi:hypothetical protein